MIKFKFRDKLGWPVERIIGRPITNFLRLLIHTNIRRTWIMRNHNDMPSQPDANICCAGKGVPMILMPELCYYCREELNFGDMALHDGHRVHKKCLPPINDTNMWDEAARRSVLGTINLVQSYIDEVLQVDETRFDELKIEIAKHFSDLRATYELLIELAIRHKKYIEVLNRCDHVRSADENVNSHLLEKLLTNPLVQAAIERSKKV